MTGFFKDTFDGKEYEISYTKLRQDSNIREFRVLLDNGSTFTFIAQREHQQTEQIKINKENYSLTNVEIADKVLRNVQQTNSSGDKKSEGKRES